MGLLGSSVRSRYAEQSWRDMLIAGSIGGLLGGIAMGIVLELGTDIIPVFGQLLGETSTVYGWIVHLITSIVFGMLFAVFVSLPLVRSLATSIGAMLLLGVIHAHGLATVMIGVFLPIATLILGLPELSLLEHLIPGGGQGGFAPAVAFATAHVVYGIILGAVYGVLRGFGTHHPERLAQP